MNSKEILLAQMDACLENTWFVSLIHSIERLTEDAADWKPSDDVNSIREIVNHLIYYNERHLNRFKNEPSDTKKVESTFLNRDGLTWDDARERITKGIESWIKELQNVDMTRVEERAEVIAHLTIHITYHTGQIILLRKLQGSWNSEDGVKG
ncbi:DinB family protein [Oceanobacillus sp. 1P07AA]|uniref:DinB family protein n=1 Tax=Oceanobacillus sp. 1P07AA TaxID=3132293 RepID=UPI0039A66717